MSNLSPKQISVLRQHRKAIYNAIAYYGKTDPEGSRKHFLITNVVKESLNRLYSDINKGQIVETAKSELINTLAVMLRRTKDASSEVEINVAQPLLSVVQDLDIAAEVGAAVFMGPYWAHLVFEREKGKESPAQGESIPAHKLLSPLPTPKNNPTGLKKSNDRTPG